MLAMEDVSGWFSARVTARSFLWPLGFLFRKDRDGVDGSFFRIFRHFPNAVFKYF